MKNVNGKSLVLIVGLAFVAIAILGASIQTTEAISGPYACTYYSSATYKKVVGYRSVGCCGATFSSGTTSLYFKCQQLLCPDVVCPD